MRGNRQTTDDDGFSIVEAVVAMMVLAVLALVAAATSITVLRTSNSNSQRVVAANLATQAIEETRSIVSQEITDGALPIETQIVGGTTYSIAQTTTVQSSNATTNLCTTGTKLAYKLVTVAVTWPNMGSVQPVTAQTLKQIGIGTRGALAVSVVGAAPTSTPQAGIGVTLTPGNVLHTTGADGCVVFTNLTPGVTYYAAVDQAGFVSIEGGQSYKTSAQSITENAISRVTISYDRPGTVRGIPVSPAGYPAPATLPLTFESSSFTPYTAVAFPDCASVTTSPKQCVTGSPRAATALFPGSYAAWAGTCLDAEPTTPAPTRTTVLAGGLIDRNIPLLDVDAVLAKSNGTRITGRTLFAYHQSADAPTTSRLGCPTVDKLKFTAQADTSAFRAALPPGRWQLYWSKSDGTLSAGNTFTLTAGATTPLALAQVGT